MEYKIFEKIILKLQLSMKRSQELYKLGIDLTEFTDPYHMVIDELFRECFNSEQMGWIDWYLYDRVGVNGDILEAFDKDKNPICYDTKSLWETVCEAGQQADFDNRLGG